MAKTRKHRTKRRTKRRTKHRTKRRTKRRTKHRTKRRTSLGGSFGILPIITENIRNSISNDIKKPYDEKIIVNVNYDVDKVFNDLNELIRTIAQCLRFNTCEPSVLNETISNLRILLNEQGYTELSNTEAYITNLQNEDWRKSYLSNKIESQYQYTPELQGSSLQGSSLQGPPKKGFFGRTLNYIRGPKVMLRNDKLIGST